MEKIGAVGYDKVAEVRKDFKRFRKFEHFQNIKFLRSKGLNMTEASLRLILLIFFDLLINSMFRKVVEGMNEITRIILAVTKSSSVDMETVTLVNMTEIPMVIFQINLYHLRFICIKNELEEMH